MAALRAKRAAKLPGSAQPGSRSLGVSEAPNEPALESQMRSFWDMGPEIDDVHVRVAGPDIELELLKVLGDPLFAQDEALRERLAKVYSKVSRRALEVAFGESEA